MMTVNRIPWDLEEAVALYDLYFRNGQSISPPMNELHQLSVQLNRRANILGIKADEKFRNISGLKLQLGCIQYVVTGGKQGMSNANKLFYKVFDLYKDDPDRYNSILKEFREKYSSR